MHSIYFLFSVFENNVRFYNVACSSSVDLFFLSFYQALCQCFKLRDLDNMNHLVLSSDHLFLPQASKHDMDDKIKALEEWWQRVVGSGPDAQLQSRQSLYLDILAR